MLQVCMCCVDICYPRHSRESDIILFILAVSTFFSGSLSLILSAFLSTYAEPKTKILWIFTSMPLLIIGGPICFCVIDCLKKRIEQRNVGETSLTQLPNGQVSTALPNYQTTFEQRETASRCSEATSTNENSGITQPHYTQITLQSLDSDPPPSYPGTSNITYPTPPPSYSGIEDYV